jgi:hypothetical protein
MAVRKLYNFLHGTLVESLSESSSTITFGRVLPIELSVTTDGAEYIPLVISPATTPEIVHLVDYDPETTIGVVNRGQEGTLPVEHFPGSPWGCKPLKADVEGAGGAVAIYDGDRRVLQQAEFMRFGEGLKVTSLDHRTALIDAGQAGVLVEGVSTVVQLDGNNDLVVTLSSNWGITHLGEPYYDPGGVFGDDVAALLYYPGPREYRLVWMAQFRETQFAATVADSHFDAHDGSVHTNYAWLFSELGVVDYQGLEADILSNVGRFNVLNVALASYGAHDAQFIS